MSKPTRTRRPIIEAIEPRLLFSATADIAVFDDGSHYVDALTHAANNLDLTQVYPDLMAQPPISAAAVTDADTSHTPSALPADTPIATSTHSLVFVDTHVDNYQALVKDILNNPDNKNVEIIYLDANQDGITQITKTLSTLSNVSSIQLISHSVAGELQLGSSVLSENTLAQFKNQLQTWQRALTNDADILIYGCDLAANTAGVNLLQDLSQITGADIAASTNTTGNATPNADWVLEKNIGHIETAALISPQQTQTWHGVLADVTYINTGSGGSNYALVPGDFAGQSFQIPSAATIDRFSVEINKTAGAAAQNLFLEIRDGYNGNVIGSATVSSTTLSNGTQWVNFDFAETSLTAYQVYWARLTTSGSDGLVAATYHNTDVFGNGTFFNNGGGASWDLSFAVTNVAATNNAPSVNIVPTTYAADEQVAMNLHGTGISVADVDGDNLTVTVAAAVNNSVITANAGTTGISIVSGNATKTLVVSGTVAQLNDFFSGNNSATLTYRIAANTPVPSTTLTITASDGTLSSNDTATINITAVNDAPTNTKPGTQNTNEDTPLVFSAGNGNQIGVADVDAGTSPVQTTLSVTNGVLSLSGITGLSFSGGDGTSDTSMTFTGTLTNINNALTGLTYTPTSNFNGSSTLTITINDLGNTGTGGPLSDTDTVTINVAAVNDAPTTDHPIPNQNAPKNVAFNYTFAANTFGDVDTGTTLTYSAQTNGGGALPAWLSFNPTTRTFSGTPTNGDVGTLNVDVTADDGSGGTVTNTFSIITSANLDTNYINTGANGFELTVSTTQQVGQSFSFTSGNGTYLVNEISLFTLAYGGAPQTVTVQLLDAWNGTVLGTSSVASADLSQTNKEWHSFDFGNVSLTDGTTYYIKVSSTGTDNAIKLGHFGNVIGGNVVINGADDTSKDLAFKMSYENGSNIAPAVDNPISDKALNTEAPLNYTMPTNTFSDADPLDTLTYRAHLVGRSDLAWITFDTATLHFGGTPHFSQIGTWQVEVVATDNHGASTSEFFDVVVSNANTVPTPIPDQNVLEGTAYNFQFTAFNNANSTPLTYTATQANGNPLPAWLNFDAANRTFYGMADDGDVNVKSIKVTASDGAGGSVSDTFTLTVINQQEPPFIVNPIADQNAIGFVPFNFSFGANVAADPDIGDTLTYSAQLHGSGAALPSWLNYNASTRTFSGTPTNADVGTLVIDVIATDTASNTATDTFNLVIAAGNTPPVNTVPTAQITNEDVPLIFKVSNGNQIQITDVDAGSNSVQVNLGVTHGGLSLAGITGLSFLTGDGTNDASMSFTGTVIDINAALATLTYTSTANYFGTDTLNITTNDLGNTGIGGAHSDSDNVSLTVLSVNDAPTVANAIPNQNATEDSAFNFQFASNTFSDVDVGDTFTYTATLNGGGALPSWLTFDAATRTFSGTPTNSDVGTLSIDVIANDGHGGNGTDTFAIIIANTNDAPTIANAIPNQNATEDSAFNFQVPANTFNDVDVGDTLTYTTQLNGGGALPAWLNFNAATRTFSGTPTNSDVGTLSIDVTANDGNGGIVTDTFALIIANTNDAPTIANAIPNQNATEDSAFNFQFASNTFNDVDVGDTLTYSSTLNGGGALPTWLTFNSATRTFSGTPTNADVGTLSIDVTASDGNGGLVTDTFALVITNTNDAPTIANAIQNQNATEDAAFNFQFTANTFNDIDVGDTLTYTTQLNGGSALPSWLSFNAATRTFSGTPTNSDVGTLNIDVTASDGNGGVITDTFALVIANTNDAPTIANAIPNQNATEDSAFNFQVPANTFNDVDVGDTLTYSSTLNGGSALPSWLTFNAATRTFSGTPTNSDVGTINIDVIASDGNGGIVTDTFALVITNTNDAPTITNAIPNQNATEDSAFNFQVPANTFNDIDVGDSLTYSSTLNGGGALPSWLTFNAATRTFSGTPTNSDVGTLSIDVIASDGNGGVITDTFALTIANTNDAPTIANAIPNQNVTEDSAFNFQIPSNTFNDVDVGDSLTYSSTLNGGGALPSWLTFNAATRTFSGTPTNADVGTINIDVTASDGNGGLVTDTFALIVANTNDAPTIANPIPNQNATEDSAFNFQVPANTFNDVDVSDTLTYTAQLNGGSALPSWLSFNAATHTFSGTPTNSDVGTLNIDVTANDGNGGIVTDTFSLVIANTNDAPTIANAIPNQNATEDSAFNFQIPANTFNDVDVGDSLTYSSTLNGGGALPSWLSFNAATRTFSGTPTNADVGTINIDVTANDGNGGIVTDTFALIVANTNDAPTIANPIPNQNATEDSAFNFQVPANTFSDVDVGDTLTYTAQLNGGSALPSWLSFNAATRTFSGTPTNADVGTINIDVTASDGNGGIVTDTFALTIANTNDAPTIANPIPNQNANEDSAFNFQVPANTFNDVDVGDSLTYNSTLNGGGALPSWLTFNAATRTFSGTPTNSDVGTLSIDVTASDGNGGVITDTFALIVANTNNAPTIANPIPNQNATEDSAFNFQIPANTFNDVDVSDTLTYTAQLNGGSALPAWLNFNAATRTFSGTPTNSDVGTLTINVTANDGHGGVVTDSFNLLIANTNDAPVVANTIPTQKATEDSAFNFQIASNTFNDVDAGDSLTYTTQLNGGSALPSWLTFNAATRTFSGTPTTTDVGTLTIDVIATDNYGESVTANFVLNVVNMNKAPTTTGIVTVNTLENSTGDVVDLFSAFADREDQDSQLTYSIVNNTNNTLVTQTTIDAQTGKLQLHYGQNQFGTSQITVRATDTGGASVDTSFAVNVAFVNQIPTSIGIKNLTVFQGSAPSTIDLANIFNDVEDGRNLKYSIVNNSNPALLNAVQINQQNHISSIVYNSTAIGETNITLRATDSNGGFVDSTFKVTVVTQPPIPPIDHSTDHPMITPLPNPSNNNGNNPITEPGKIVTGSETPISGGKNPNATGETTDNNLSHNLIGGAAAGDAHIITTPTNAKDADDSFDHNRYDRIVQQELITKKINEPLCMHTLVSSLILPGEGFSSTDAAEFSAQVRKIHQEMENTIAEEQQQKAILSGLTLSVTTGILIWSLRASSLLLTLMSMLPLWRGIDPLPILEEVQKRKKDIEKQRDDKKAEDKNAKEVGYLFDNKSPKDNG